MRAAICKIMLGFLASSLVFCFPTGEVQAADTLQRQPTLRTLQPAQPTPTATRPLATQPAQMAPTAPLVRTSPTAQAVPARAVVSRAAPSRPALTAAGGSVTVTLSGSNLDLITSGQVIIDGRTVQGAAVRVGLGTATSRSLTLTLPSGVEPGRYQIKVMAGTQSIILPAAVF